MATIIVAIAKNNVIGKSNDLPWYLPADLKHFKEVTTGHAVIMGRKTFESILSRLGKPLPNRTNIVVTRDQNYRAEGALVVNSIEDAFKAADEQKTFVIGGAEIYKQAIDQVNELLVTEVEAKIDGDTFFPPIDESIWHETSRESHHKDEKNPYDYVFITYQRS